MISDEEADNDSNASDDESPESSTTTAKDTSDQARKKLKAGYFSDEDASD
jgi:hypothetical protein